MATRKASLLGIDASMYKTFAIATVAITLIVAFMGGGGGSSSDGGLTYHNAEADALAGPKKPTDDASAAASAAPPAPQQARSDAEPGDPQAGTQGMAVEITAMLPVQEPVARVRAPRPLLKWTPKVDPKILEHMTPEQRAAYLKEVAARAEKFTQDQAAAAAPTAAQIDHLMAASRARSGNGFDADD